MRVAIVGATGAVGTEMIRAVDASGLPIESLQLFASERSEGERVIVGGSSRTIEAWSLERLAADSWVLLSAGCDFARTWAPAMVGKGARVIDNSSGWRMDPEVPLVVPEVNSEQLVTKPGITANPNCAAIPLTVALQPLSQKFGLSRLVVTTLQSVSGSGRRGLTELRNQLSEERQGMQPQVRCYSQPIAGNVIGQIGPLDEAGHSDEEEKIIRETRKILDLPSLEVSATAVRVPVLFGHSLSVTVELSQEVAIEEAKSVLYGAPGLEFVSNSDPAQLPSPFLTAGTDRVKVGRMRLMYNQNRSRWVQLWVVVDNLRKGAATNAVQILTQLVERQRGAL